MNIQKICSLFEREMMVKRGQKQAVIGMRIKRDDRSRLVLF
jgi:hypothetical protein